MMSAVWVRGLAVSLWFAGALTATPVWAVPPAAPVERLHALFDAAWQRDLRDDPIAASYYGDTRFNDRWPDLSPAARERIRAADQQVLVDLATIPIQRLPAPERLNHELFRREYESRIEAARFHAEYFTMTAHDGVQTLNEVAENMPFDSVADYEIWLKRIEAAPA
ncbi:MAG TPA: DUF885 family protein, partial [Albitalea sp.]|nr:DUF885 family protein [Albitalea sp.]